MKDLKSQNGFSLVEMITTTVIVTIFILGISTILIQFGTQQEGFRATINTDLDDQLAERVISRDLQNAAPSLNNVNLQDDQGLGFFDYYPDVTPTNDIGKLRRVLSLAPGKKTEIYFVLTDTHHGPPMLYDPTAAYSFGSPPANMNTVGAWSFVSVNRNGYVDRLNPNLWTEGRLLMLDTPARVRSTATAKERPRSPFFIGQVERNSLSGVTSPILDRRDPITAEIIDTADKFFRRAPTMSGGSPIVRLKAVQIVRYFSKPSPLKPGLIDIYRQTYSRGSFSGEQLFAKSIRGLQFTRASIFQPVFAFQLTTEKSTAPIVSIPISIMPSSPMDMNNFVIAGTSTRSEAAPFVLNVRLNCTKGSLAADYPIATTNSTLAFHFSLKPGNGTIVVRFPAHYSGKYDATDNPMPYTDISSQISGPGATGARAAIAANLLRIEIPAQQVTADPANPSASIPTVADDFFFESAYYSSPYDYLTGGPPETFVMQRTYDHLYQAAGSYSADLGVSIPAGTSDPNQAPLRAVFQGSPLVRRTNVLDCQSALAP